MADDRPDPARPGPSGPAPSLWVVILAGGVGSRFWPVSTPERPKQLLPLGSSKPLIRDTVDRALRLVSPGRLRILTGHGLMQAMRPVLPDLPDSCFMLEPCVRGTGPVLAWAAHRIATEDPEAVLVSLHSDHVIHPEAAFAPFLESGARVARDEDLLLTVAVPPSRPETGFGYIRPGDPLPSPAGTRAFRVSAFEEKPDGPTAARYLEEGYLWNSGLFIWSARRFLEEIRLCAPEIADALHLLDQDDATGFFEGVRPISVDEAVLERSTRVGSIEAAFDWDDVGSWEALSRTTESDRHGNVSVGHSHVVESSDNIVFSDEGEVVLFGVKDLVVVRSGRTTLVMPRGRAADLKSLLEQLPPSGVASADSVGGKARDTGGDQPGVAEGNEPGVVGGDEPGAVGP